MTYRDAKGHFVKGNPGGSTAKRGAHGRFAKAEAKEPIAQVTMNVYHLPPAEPKRKGILARLLRR